MKKKLYLALSILATTVLASCGGKSNSVEPEGFKPSLDPESNYVIKVVGDYSNFEALEEEVGRFNAYYPKVKLNYVKIDGDLITVLEGKEKPNIFFSHPKMIGNEQYASVVAHMEDLSDPALKLNLDSIRSSLLKREGGKVYMVPVFSRTYGALVNKDLFAKEGIEIPTSWTKLVETCASFRAKGYQSPVMGYTNYDLDKNKERTKVSNGLQNTIAYPLFVAELAKNPSALELAQKSDPAAGEYMRGALETVKRIFDTGIANLEECDKITDSYEQVLLRFFEGDVPMMVCNGDTVSGAKKREGKSVPFGSNPFSYAFYPMPTTEQGGYFIDSPSVQFSVNKNCDNLDMTNEFMRFLLQTKELDHLASWKGLICSTNTTPFAPVYDKDKKTYTPIYDPFNNVPADRTISPEKIGINDAIATQIRIASFYVGRGDMSIDEAVQRYGQLS